MNCNVKYSNPIEFNPYCKLIFSGNTIPRLGRGRDSEAIIDRLIIVPFNASFDNTSTNYSPFIKYQLRDTECMKYLVRLGIEGLQRVLNRNAFTSCEAVEHEITEYEEVLNPIRTFFEEMGDGLEHEPTQRCYRLYDQFCHENSLKPMSHVEFSRQVKDWYGYEIRTLRIDGRPTKVFMPKGE